MNGHASFNQVFFTDAKIPADWIVGREEQRLEGGDDHARARAPPADGVAALERRRSHGTRFTTKRAPNWKRPTSPTSGIRSAPGASISSCRAQRKPARTDPRGSSGDRQADDHVAQHELDGAPRRAPRSTSASPQGPEGSLGKLAASNVARQAAHVHTLITGAESMLTGSEPARRDHRGDSGVGAGDFDRRRHRRDSAQHHRRTRARPAERAALRRRSVPGYSAQRLAPAIHPDSGSNSGRADP